MASDIAVQILKDIRDEMRGMRAEQVQTNHRLDQANQRLDQTNQRLDVVETTLLDLAEQQRFVVRYMRAISERDAHLEPRVSSLEARVDKLESR